LWKGNRGHADQRSGSYREQPQRLAEDKTLPQDESVAEDVVGRIEVQRSEVGCDSAVELKLAALCGHQATGYQGSSKRKPNRNHFCKAPAWQEEK
jgi:hypothetical protein